MVTFVVSTHLNKHASQTANLPHQTFQAQEVVLHPREPKANVESKWKAMGAVKAELPG